MAFTNWAAGKKSLGEGWVTTTQLQFRARPLGMHLSREVIHCPVARSIPEQGFEGEAIHSPFAIGPTSVQGAPHFGVGRVNRATRS